MPHLEILIRMTASSREEAEAMVEAIEDGGGIESKAGLTELASDIGTAYYFIDESGRSRLEC